MASKPSIALSIATHDDVPRMTDVYINAFEHTLVSQRSFPSSESQSRAYWANWIESKLDVADTHMVVARIVPSSSSSSSSSSHNDHNSNGNGNGAGAIVGWARWVRVPAAPLPDPPLVFSPSLYPSRADGSVAALFFGAAHNARRRIMGAREHWFLSMIVTHTDVQRKGVGSALMRYGLERADADGWTSFLNASPDGKPLYDLFGFESVDETLFEDWNSVMYHMTREPKPIAV